MWQTNGQFSAQPQRASNTPPYALCSHKTHCGTLALSFLGSTFLVKKKKKGLYEGRSIRGITHEKWLKEKRKETPWRMKRRRISCCWTIPRPPFQMFAPKPCQIQTITPTMFLRDLSRCAKANSTVTSGHFGIELYNKAYTTYCKHVYK